MSSIDSSIATVELKMLSGETTILNKHDKETTSVPAVKYEYVQISVHWNKQFQSIPLL